MKQSGLLKVFEINGMLIDMKEYLKKNQSIISIRALEIEIGCPPSTLQKVIKNGRGIPKKWKEPLYKYLKSKLYDDFPLGFWKGEYAFAACEFCTWVIKPTSNIIKAKKDAKTHENKTGHEVEFKISLKD